MRGLAKTALTTASTAVVGAVACVLLMGGCNAGGQGTRDEGPARSARAMPSTSAESPSASATPMPTPAKLDAVKLVKNDPKVSPDIKRDLKPCAADEYPVDVSYGRLTGGPADDIVVNVMTCGDAVGIGSYVYRAKDEKYENVFTSEEPPVYSEIDRGELLVTKLAYGKRDAVDEPSGEDLITYRWKNDRFEEHGRTHNEYGKTVTSADPDSGITPSIQPEPEGW